MDAGAKAGATNSEAVSETNSVFNDIEVPPMKELNGAEMEKDISKGYWYVDCHPRNATRRDNLDLSNSRRFIKHYSPYCHHCQAIAPTWQTLYEYYYVRLAFLCSENDTKVLADV